MGEKKQFQWSYNGFKQGFYRPINPKKYIGTVNGSVTDIKYRSSWELRFMKYLDNSENCLRWNSEGVRIPYISPVDGNLHHYWMDFYVEFEVGDIVEKYLIEIKPFSQTKPPENIKRRTEKQLQRYINESKTYLVNVAKWKAAEEYAKVNNIKFAILTEHNLDFLDRRVKTK